MLPSSVILFLLIILTLAALEDLRIREVPDVLSYFVIAGGLAYAGYISITTANPSPLIHSIGGVTTAYLFGLTLMYLNMWGGGDTKLLMGVSTFLTAWPPTDILTYIFLLFFLGSLYGMAWTVYLIVTNWSELLKKHQSFEKIPFITGAAILAASVLITVLIPSAYQLLFTLALSTLFISITATYILQRSQDTLTVQDVPKENIVLGDWLTESVEVEDGTVYPRNTGVNETDLERIRRSNRETLRVRYGVPFVPSFLIAYIALLYLQINEYNLLTIMFSLIV